MSESKNNSTKISFLYDTQNSIVFEDNLDLLLNNRNIEIQGEDNATDKHNKAIKITRLKAQEEIFKNGDAKKDGGEKFDGGIILPNSDEHSDGSGNIIIVGDYGAGKTTLAFQIAATCANKRNNGIAVFYSLEITRTQTIENYMTDNGKKGYAKKLVAFNSEDTTPEMTADSLSKKFKEALKKKDKTDIPCRQILFPHLTPRTISTVTEGNDSSFAKRYKEIKNMLVAIEEYNKNTSDPAVKAVVIDSLNVFGNTLLTREEIYRLFELFKLHKIIGVFTLESALETDRESTRFVNDAKFMADTVITLKKTQYNQYYNTYISVEKSRNLPQVLGIHPYKIKEAKNDKGEDPIMAKKIEVYPSLHYLLYGTEDNENEDNRLLASEENEMETILMGDEVLAKALKYHLLAIKDKDGNKTKPHISDVITFYGESGAYKSCLAHNALLYGLARKENGLIICLNDRNVLEERGVRFNEYVYNQFKAECIDIEKKGKEEKKYLKLYCNTSDDFKNKYSSKYKYNINRYCLHEPKTPEEQSPEQNPKLIEIVFKNGALLPEEFLDIVRRIIVEEYIKRVAFVDLKTIGISYPFLVNSESSGNMFIPAFLHLMRNYGVNVYLSSSYSHVAVSDDIVNQAITLSDDSIRCDIVVEKDKDTGLEKPDTTRCILSNSTLALEKKVLEIIRPTNEEYGLKIMQDESCKYTPTYSLFKIKPYPNDDSNKSSTTPDEQNT